MQPAVGVRRDGSWAQYLTDRWPESSLARRLVQRPAYPSLPQRPAAVAARLERASGASNLK